MQYKTDKEIENEFEKEFSIDFLNLKKDFKEAVLSQRQQDREAIREEIGKFTVYYRSKYSLDCSREETEKEKETEMIELTNLLSFLDGLEGE